MLKHLNQDTCNTSYSSSEDDAAWFGGMDLFEEYQFPLEDGGADLPAPPQHSHQQHTPKSASAVSTNSTVEDDSWIATVFQDAVGEPQVYTSYNNNINSNGTANIPQASSTSISMRVETAARHEQEADPLISTSAQETTIPELLSPTYKDQPEIATAIGQIENTRIGNAFHATTQAAQRVVKVSPNADTSHVRKRLRTRQASSRPGRTASVAQVTTEQDAPAHHCVNHAPTQHCVDHAPTQHCVDHAQSLTKGIQKTSSADSQDSIASDGSRKEFTSRFRGVCWYKRTKKWVVQIKVNGKRKHIGYYSDEEVAADAYDDALRKLIIAQKKTIEQAASSQTKIRAPRKRAFNNRTQNKQLIKEEPRS